MMLRGWDANRRLMGTRGEERREMNPREREEEKEMNMKNSTLYFARPCYITIGTPIKKLIILIIALVV